MTDHGRRALCINIGTSSLKAALVHEDGSAERRAVPVHGRAGLASAVDEAVRALLADAPAPDVVGHRVVHGGREFTEPVIVDDDVLERLRALIPLAPLHQPGAIAGIEQVTRQLPYVVQVACFDTAFHRALPVSATRLPIPERYDAIGIRRYGFHGLSYEYVVEKLGERIEPRTVVAHLGSGSSLAVLLDGTPVDTTMGLTPGGGMVMATRSGDLDPGVVLRLVQLESDAARTGIVLERESGLLALGGSADVRELVAAAEDDAGARLAVDAFTMSVAKSIAAAGAVLEGLDLVVFTGGIGSASAEIRAAVARRLGHLGMALDDGANDRSANVISAEAARVTVRVVPTDEEVMIARHAWNTAAG